MQYFGGKARISKPLSEFLNSCLEDEQPFVDAFCGSCNVISKIDSNRTRIANDIHLELISMWKALQGGWKPPVDVTEDIYKDVRENGEDYEKGFVGFGCSYSGKYWGGYARGGEGRNYAENAYNSVMKKLKYLGDVDFHSLSYLDLPIPEGALVYCDIPYKNTTQYSTGYFDHEVFYEWAQRIPNVLVSEYAQNVPDDAKVVWEYKSKKDIRNKEGVQEPTTEVVWTYDKKYW